VTAVILPDWLITVDAARHLYADGNAGHDFDHVLRVLASAEHIGAAEGADMRVVRAACLLHDVARPEADAAGACHAEWGARRARHILAEFPEPLVGAVAHAIAAHRFRGQSRPETLEAQVLSDADKLDAIGAIGVARAYAIAGAERQHLWSSVQAGDYTDVRDIPPDEHTPVHEYLFKLRALRDRLYTPTARSIAEGRHRFMAQFFDELDCEVNGKA
jgi:uncharacterized protein